MAERKSGGPERRPGRTRLLSLVGGASVAALSWGWTTRDQLDLLPDVGLGYALGVAGLTMMIVLLLYSLRKRVQIMRSWAPIGWWFQIHMILGVLGPTAILFHCNFELGSMNSAIALFSTLLVSSSGIVGRVAYTRIHYGLSGQRATVEALRRDAELGRESVAQAAGVGPVLSHLLDSFERRTFAAPSSTARTVLRFMTLGLQVRRTLRRARRLVDSSGVDPRVSQPAFLAVRDQVVAIRRLAHLGFYERVFSLWHAVHLPLCFLLFASAAVHVVAVHMY